MKIKTPVQVYDSTGKTSLDIIKQLQAMTDDLRNILKGGLSFADGQLPFQYREVNVTSGSPVNLNIQTPYQIIGCIPIQTYGVTITGQTTNLLNGIFTITLTMSSTTARIGFLMIGNNT